MRCTSETATENYVPPVLGNGGLSVMLDMEGCQRQRSYPGHLTPMIWWAGRRYDTRLGELIPFGYLCQSTASPASWSQNLDTQQACIETESSSADGDRLRTEAFVHLNLPILALRKTCAGEFTLTYHLAQPGTGGEPPRRMRFLSVPNPQGVDIHYEIAGLEPYHGTISLLCDRPVRVSVAGNRFKLTVPAGPAAFFLVFVDSLDAADVPRTSLELRQTIAREGYDGLFASHRKAWAAYWAESYVRLADARQTAVYEVAQYHLRISSTRWSLPTGIFATHWHGRYFGFDELFPFMALAGSGHLDLARKIPEFRYQVLEKAVVRAYRYFGSDYHDTGARYHWETDENGDDRTPSGFWLEHIFHLAHIALCAWHYYQFSGDCGYLAEKGYPVIAKCADFYASQSLCRTEGGRLIVGKCTDLERLGSARENAFMTTCGVIATFEAAAAAAEKLGVDPGKAQRWRELATALRESLPQTEDRYIPYPGCDQKSVAMFAGTFPYPVLPPDDAKQLTAIEDFLANEAKYGNMYPVGNSICVWYAGWMGVVFARLGQFDRVQSYIERAVGETNCFSEIFEISKPVNHPWFTTAEGVFIQMVNESLLQSSAGKIRILPNPAGTCGFKLAAMGGVMVEASLANGSIQTLRLHASQPYSGTLTLPSGESIPVELKAGEERRFA
ncbi:MAG: hypothetical protein RBU25_03360 [Lentisphaeria bacterium]|jgi:hypothetical protein|nr:hypothetical protein [Lentisphaeria bacterium]